MGSGKNLGFSKLPDLQQWGILTVGGSGLRVEGSEGELTRQLPGKFIAGWLRLFGCELWTIILEPIEGHGSWDGKAVFGELPGYSNYEGPVAILTRATIRLNKLSSFWQHVGPVSAALANAPGLICSMGIGEIPWIKQATFSIWESKAAMKAFAYGMQTHRSVIKKTHDQHWYSEEMFVRFKIIDSKGTVRGVNPLDGKS